MPAYKDKRNNTWYVKYSQKELDGKFHGKTKRGFATKREAVQWETEEKRKIHGVFDMIPLKWTHEINKRVSMEVGFFYGKKAKIIC